METKAEASSISIKKYQPANFAEVLEAYLQKVTPPQKEHLSGADHHQASDEV